MKQLDAQASDETSRQRVATRAVDTLCPYCGVGCAVTYVADVDHNRIVHAIGRDGAANAGRLCVKGRYGHDYASHPQRLTRPLIRLQNAYPKGQLSPMEQRPGKPGGPVEHDAVLPHFREASWDEALQVVADRLLGIRESHGSDALAGFGSAKGSNEEAYLFQKLVRAVLGTNNVDHCTRLCHASSVAALLESMGSAAVTNVVRDVARADVAILTGCNPTENHPVAATFIKDAAAAGTRLIVINSRRPQIADYAALYLPIRPGTDVALYNAMLHVIIRDDLLDHAFIRERTEGFEAVAEAVREVTPAAAERICGVPAADIEQAARMLGEANAAMFFWGMGISQHTRGTDNARCLISLAMVTGNVGRPGTGLHPLRGQNNVQGASDAGLIPMVYPDYQRVDDPAVQERFERDWGVPLSPRPGLTVTEIISAARDGDVRGMYILGENPFISDPDVNKVREGLANLDFLVVQDIFLTETAEFADVILPASSFMEKAGSYTNTDRRVQLGAPVLQPPGEARQDWELICEIAQRMGYPMAYDSVADVFDEFAACTESYASLSHAALGLRGRWYPCSNPETSDGEPIVFGDAFPRGPAMLVATRFTPADEQPDGDFPLVLSTGRVLEHWHTGTMTRRSAALDTLAPDASVELNPTDARKLGISDGQQVRVTSRRGTITLMAELSEAVLPGTVFIPMHFREACANLLTNPAVDPWGKIPGFKFCAVRVEAAREAA
ncbi:formate dehydrogenase major subunit [Natronocella acetinitrilica]|uniref:nitrate reductase (cytochrome) n=1 Tax=Natronocella acetinitrilica TaxID=414046 RepID=A0AAE3G1I1_9GAMM|nr:formate dehydrogenase subunit alpha [Natronocella acetinitrilica]MCP1673289.1 formate dehydrogenase major subunit [Natronocella acetinitrilica]